MVWLRISGGRLVSVAMIPARPLFSDSEFVLVSCGYGDHMPVAVTMAVVVASNNA